LVYYSELIIDNAQNEHYTVNLCTLFVSCHFRIYAGDIGYSD